MWLGQRIAGPVSDEEVHAEVLKHRRSDAFALTDQPEQYVLGADVFVPKPFRFFPRHRENLSNALGEVVSVHRVDPMSFARMPRTKRARAIFASLSVSCLPSACTK